MFRMSKRIVGSTLGLFVSLALGLTPAHAAEELVFVSWGGAYQDAIRTAWLEPFASESGVDIIEDTSPEIAKIKAMVETDTISWDVVTAGGAGLADGIKQGLFEEITDDMVSQDHVLEDARSPYGVPSEIFSTVMAFSTKAFPDGGAQPQSWADFWDVEKFPGKRAMYDRPNEVLEAALMADGVAQDDVYDVLRTPEGLDRAFAKVEALKPHISIWWHSGAQPVQALGSGEADLAIGWNGRFQKGIDDGLDIAMAWDGAIAQMGYFMIVKGAKNKDAAVKFLNYIVSPVQQGEFSKHVAYGPVTEAAWEFIDDERAARLPSTPDRIKTSLFSDSSFWADGTLGRLTERLTGMIQQ